MKSFIVICLLGVAFASPTPGIYSGAQVFRVLPKDVNEISYLRNLERRAEYDFWRETTIVGESVDIMAKRWMVPVLKATLEKANIDYTIHLSDVETAISEAFESNEKSREIHGKAMDWNSYHTYQEMMDWVDTLPDTYPGLAYVETIGASYEGRPLKMVRVSNTGGTANKGVFVDGGIHAREWIAPATSAFFLNELLVNSTQYSDTLDVVDFYFVVSVNPDGYNYSWTDDRMWRKTRGLNDGSTCIGTDGNRNWGYHWGEDGSSDGPCTDTYKGDYAFSEAETSILSQKMIDLSLKLDLYVTLHCYGKVILYPWGYMTDLALDWQDLDSLASDAAAAIEAVRGTAYRYGDSGDLYGAAAGASDDWAKGSGGMKYSYTIELPDNSFILDESEIIPVGVETFEGFQVMFEFIRDMQDPNYDDYNE